MMSWDRGASRMGQLRKLVIVIPESRPVAHTHYPAKKVNLELSITEVYPTQHRGNTVPPGNIE